ncbi:MAG: hypothetical protein K8R54_08355 [Bacteroidales bacterium]|nr:hypothetical protein [Bacteroidales bacterium]
MIFTRKKGWKEIKFGKIFYTEDNVRISTERNEITSSVYCARLGIHPPAVNPIASLTN